MERHEKAGLVGKSLASAFAAIVATFVGSEMLQEVQRTRHERALLASVCMVVFFGVWACWEVLQVRQHLGLAPEIHNGD